MFFVLSKTLGLFMVPSNLSAAKDDVKCRSYGSSPGESAYVQCRATLDSARTLAEQLSR
jgi:hypothetical protein